jgi:cytochrome c553
MVEQLMLFRDNKRIAPAMNVIAQALTTDQMRHVARYFSAQARGPGRWSSLSR